MHDLGLKKESQSIASNVSNVDNVEDLEVKEESKIKESNLNTLPGRKIFRVVPNQILSELTISAGEIITVHGANMKVSIGQETDMQEIFVR